MNKQEQAQANQIAEMKRQLKNSSKNELIRALISLGNSVAFLKAENERLVEELKGEEDAEVSS